MYCFLLMVMEGNLQNILNKKTEPCSHVSNAKHSTSTLLILLEVGEADCDSFY